MVSICHIVRACTTYFTCGPASLHVLNSVAFLSHAPPPPPGPLRHVGDDKGRTHELEQSAVKCMRGILFCYMRQAEKVSSSSLFTIASLQVVSGMRKHKSAYTSSPQVQL